MVETDDDRTERFAHAFDDTAANFDELGAYLWRPIGAATVEATRPAEGERVLDACCGNGASALPAAHLVGSRGTVDAVDLSEILLEQLAQRANALPQLATHRADVTAWEPNGYDIVHCALGIFFFPDMTAGTEHLISRARPGGRVGLTIWRRGAVEQASEHLLLALQRVVGIDPEPRPDHLIYRVNEPEAFERWLTELGLHDVAVVEHELRVPMTPEVAWLVIVGSGFVAMLAGLDSEQVAEVRTAYLRSLAEAGVTVLDATTLIGTGVRL
ncbi:MAG: methyltransferase domain-containing protein [Leucobacter sp.]